MGDVVIQGSMLSSWRRAALAALSVLLAVVPLSGCTSQADSSECDRAKSRYTSAANEIRRDYDQGTLTRESYQQATKDLSSALDDLQVACGNEEMLTYVTATGAIPTPTQVSEQIRENTKAVNQEDKASNPVPEPAKKLKRPEGVDEGPMKTDLGYLPLGYVRFEWDVTGKKQKLGTCKSLRTDLVQANVRAFEVEITGSDSVERAVVTATGGLKVSVGEPVFIEIFDCDKNTKSVSCSIVGVDGEVADEQSARVRSGTKVRCEYEMPQLEDLPGYERYSELSSQMDGDTGE